MDNNEKPLVTFALFAYNQEDYIREAIEGAFSQTYEPLEIILSDDCSTDRTFEIMQEMTVNYDGPNVVKVRKNEVNLGTALHVHTVAMISEGAVIVVASGDDISYSHRTEEIMSVCDAQDSLVSCVHSGAFFFTESREHGYLAPPKSESLVEVNDRKEFLLRDKLPFLSPTCAYSREVFLKFDPIMGGSIIEDGVLAMRSLVCGAVISVEEPLVYIRKQEETSGTGNTIKKPIRWNRFVLSRIISYSNKLRDLSVSGVDEETANKLGSIYRKKIVRLSTFMTFPLRSETRFGKLKHFIFYLLLYPSKASFLNKVGDAFKTSGYERSALYRLAVTVFKKDV